LKETSVKTRDDGERINGCQRLIVGEGWLKEGEGEFEGNGPILVLFMVKITYIHIHVKMYRIKTQKVNFIGCYS
jgi:hypothetical protein